MKINEVITKEAVISDLNPQQRKEQDEMARREYRALVAMKSPNALEFANLFMRFYNEFGSVDNAYQHANGEMRKRDAQRAEKQKADDERKTIRRTTSAASALKGLNNPKGSALKIGATGRRGGQLGNQNAAKSGSGRLKALGKGLGNWAKDTIPGGKYIVKGADAVGRAYDSTIGKATQSARSGYDFLNPGNELQKFLQTKRKGG